MVHSLKRCLAISFVSSLWVIGKRVKMYPTSSDWLACLGLCPVYAIPSARVSFVPRGKLEKPLLKQELLFLSDQQSKFSSSLSLLESQPLAQRYFSHHPLSKDDHMFISNCRTMSVMCHSPYNSHIRHRLIPPWERYPFVCATGQEKRRQEVTLMEHNGHVQFAPRPTPHPSPPCSMAHLL